MNTPPQQPLPSTTYIIEVPYAEFIERFFMRSARGTNLPFAVLGVDDPLLPQLQKAVELKLRPELHIQFRPAGEIIRDEYLDGTAFRDNENRPKTRPQDLYMVWYKSDWDISFKKNEEFRKGAEERESQFWKDKERVDKLWPKIAENMLLEEKDARKIAENIIKKNLVVIEEQFLNGGGNK